MTGSSARLARGASHQKCTASAHRGPTDFLSRSSWSMIAGESGLAGGAAGCCAATRTAAHTTATMIAQRIDVVIASFPYLRAVVRYTASTNISVVHGPVVAPYRVS